MKYLLVLLLAIAGVNCDFEPGFHVRFPAYYDMPQTEADAHSNGWLQTDSVVLEVDGLKAYCYSDYVYCLFFDDNGFFSGLQIALSKTNYTDNPYDWEIDGFSSWTSPAGEDYWTVQLYCVDQEYIDIDAAERAANRDNSKFLPMDGIWVSSFNNEFYKIPLTREGLATTPFVRQGCYPGMGYHNYYKVSETLECTSENFTPWVPLEHDGVLVGIAMANYGRIPEATPRDWFERSTRTFLENTLINGSSCEYELADSNGLITSHIYFVKDPGSITCP